MWITGASVSDDYKIVKNEKGCWLNEYRMKMRQGDIYVEVVDYPLAHAETKSDIETSTSLKRPGASDSKIFFCRK